MRVVNGLIVAGLMAGAVGIAALTPNAQATQQKDQCTVKPVGSSNTANQKDSKFTRKGSIVTGKFRVIGKNCNETVSIAAWETNGADARPLSKQRLYAHQTRTYKTGVHTISVEVPNVKVGKVPTCFYQVDMIRGKRVDMDTKSPGAEHYGNKRLLGFVVGGKKKCQEKPVTPEDHPQTPVTPETPTTPTTPQKEELPAELPHTGPLQVVSQLVGAGSLAASSAYYWMSRRKLGLE